TPTARSADPDGPARGVGSRVLAQESALWRYSHSVLSRASTRQGLARDGPAVWRGLRLSGASELLGLDPCEADLPGLDLPDHADGTGVQRLDHGVVQRAGLEHERLLPGLPVVVRGAQRAAAAREAVPGVAAQQLARPGIVLAGLRMPRRQLRVVPRVHELGIDPAILPALPAIGRDGDPAVPAAGVIARVQQHPAVGELHDRGL